MIASLASSAGIFTQSMDRGSGTVPSLFGLRTGIASAANMSCFSTARLFVDLHLHAMVKGSGYLVDMLKVGRQKGVEIDAFPQGNGHARREMAEMTAYAHYLGMDALSQLDRGPDFVDRRLDPDRIAIGDALCFSNRRVEENSVGVGSFAKLVYPWVLVAVSAVNVRKLEVD